MNKQAELGVSYARGFINKMAEAGVPEQASIAYLQKQALSLPTTAGAIGGGALAAMLSKPEKKVDKDGNEKVKYHRLRNFILGALGGGAVGAMGNYVYNQTPAGVRAQERTASRPNFWTLLAQEMAKAKADSGEATPDAGGATP